MPAVVLSRVRFAIRARSGLEGQLLGVTIQHEQPELEKAKSVMLRQEEGFKVTKIIRSTAHFNTGSLCSTDFDSSREGCCDVV